jgi:hypothetical protein
MPDINNNPAVPVPRGVSGQAGVDRDLGNILLSGEISNIYLGGTNPNQRVATIDDIPTINNVLLSDGSIPLDQGYVPASEMDIVTLKQINDVNDVLNNALNDIQDLQTTQSSHSVSISNLENTVSKITYEYEFVNNLTITDSNFTTISTLATPVYDAGMFKVTISVKYSYSNPANPAKFRYSVNLGAWNEFTGNVTSSSDLNAGSYTFLIDHPGGDNIDILLQGATSDNADTLTIKEALSLVEGLI